MNIRHVRFRQSGGFAGLIRGSDLVGDQLSDAERRALQQHLRTAPGAPPASEARDQLVYELEVETDSGTVRLEFGEDGVPRELASLVDGMAARARPVPP